MLSLTFLIPSKNTYFPPEYIKNYINTQKQIKGHDRLTETTIPKFQKRNNAFAPKLYGYEGALGWELENSFLFILGISRNPVLFWDEDLPFL